MVPQETMSDLSAAGELRPANISHGSVVPADDRPVQTIRPARRRIKLRDLFDERQIISVLAARDLKVKYKQSLLGPLWLVFQPVALLAGFVVGFSKIANVHTGGVPYTVFALAGLTVWSFFQASATIGSASVVSNSQFVRFTPCPRIAFPPAAIIASVPTFVVTAGGAVVAAAIAGDLSPRVILVPLVACWLLVLTLGFVGITSSLMVRYRDINSALPFLLQVGMFLAPVGYSIESLNTRAQAVIGLNPLTGVIESMRWAMRSGYDPLVTPIAVSAIVTVPVVVGGWRLFSRLETTMADDI
jgi:lipopolysaccharide transport system permease protein